MRVIHYMLYWINHIIPVINENDAVATAEIKVGDNDNLSALVAILVQAEQLLLINGINKVCTKAILVKIQMRN